MRNFALLLLACFPGALAACDSGASTGDTHPLDLGTDGSGGGTDAGHDAGGGTDAGMGADLGPITELSGMLTTDQCGNFHVGASLDIPPGAEVTICAGTVLTFDTGVGIRVRGTLHVLGTAASHVAFGGGPSWSGITNSGTMDAAFLDVTDARIGLSTLAGATTTVTDSVITVPTTSAFGLAIAGGATIDRSQILGGATMTVTGGTLSMTDSTIDLQRPPGGPDIDCTHNTGGSMALDHVLITNCHCPLHFEQTDTPVMVTNSILGNASVDPIMIRNTMGTFHGNAFLGTGVQFLDIGGNIHADIGMNYWGQTTDCTADVSGAGGNCVSRDGAGVVITGRSDILTSMPAGVGPR